MVRKNRTPVGAPDPKKLEAFVSGAEYTELTSITLTEEQKREHVKLSDKVKLSYPLSIISMMQPKDISQLRDDENAPRGYKAIALQFNRYEYDRLEQLSMESGISKNKFIRNALDVAYKKAIKKT
jgi:hypothetical protein